MQFNAKDDFVNEYQQELEQELLAEQKLETEQDHDFDKKNLTKLPDMDFWEEQAFENERQGGKSIFDDEPEEEY